MQGEAAAYGKCVGECIEAPHGARLLATLSNCNVREITAKKTIIYANDTFLRR